MDKHKQHTLTSSHTFTNCNFMNKPASLWGKEVLINTVLCSVHMCWRLVSSQSTQSFCMMKGSSMHKIMYFSFQLCLNWENMHKSQTSFFRLKISKGYYVMPFLILHLTNTTMMVASLGTGKNNIFHTSKLRCKNRGICYCQMLVTLLKSTEKKFKAARQSLLSIKYIQLP